MGTCDVTIKWERTTLPTRVFRLIEYEKYFEINITRINT